MATEHRLDCLIAESGMRQLLHEPVLSIVIPTYERSAELALAVSSIAEQLTGELAQKVEIIITDNASGPDTVGKIKHLARQYPCVSYLLHARDEGGFFQFFAAPWRARGRYTWVFGSDDMVLEGGVAHVVELLEREQPSFLTMNKKVFSRDLDQELWSAANAVPDRRFERFEDLFAQLGINQFAFISGNVELTASARAVDLEPFLKVDSRHPHVAAFLAKHHGKPSLYCASPFLIHRLNNSTLGEYHLGNFFDYGVTLPILLHQVLSFIGAPPDYFERMTGDKRIMAYDAEDGPTFVDTIFENILRAMSGGKYLTVSQRRALEAILAGCAEGRLVQMGEIWRMQEQMLVLEQQVDQSKAMLEQGRQACLPSSKNFIRPG
jgi:glycosyltransferase involved in cell wall biosynthesis